MESSIHWFLKASLFGLCRSKNSGPDCYVESTGSFGTLTLFFFCGAGPAITYNLFFLSKIVGFPNEKSTIWIHDWGESIYSYIVNI